MKSSEAQSFIDEFKATLTEVATLPCNLDIFITSDSYRKLRDSGFQENANREDLIDDFTHSVLEGFEDVFKRMIYR